MVWRLCGSVSKPPPPLPGGNSEDDDLIGGGIVKLLKLLPGVKVEWTNTFGAMADGLMEFAGQRTDKAVGVIQGPSPDELIAKQRAAAARAVGQNKGTPVTENKQLDDLINKYRLEIETMGMSAKQAEVWRISHKVASGTADEFGKALQRMATPKEVQLLKESSGVLSALEKQMSALETRKSLDAENPYVKLQTDLAKYTIALREGAITQEEFAAKSAKAWNDMYSQITGRSLDTPLSQYQESMRQLNDAVAKGRVDPQQHAALQQGLGDKYAKDTAEKRTSVLGYDPAPLATLTAKLRDMQREVGRTITVEEYWTAAAKLRNQILGVAPTALQQIQDYQNRIAQLTEALQRGAIDQNQFDAAQRKAQQDMFGVGETPLQELESYREELSKLTAAYKAGGIDAEQFASKMAELQQSKLGVGPSIAQQMQSWKSQVSMLQQSGIGGQQLQDALKNSAPDFVKNLYDQTRTPVEKYLETVNQLKQWRAAGMSDDLYAKGVLQAKQQLGVGEIKLATASELGSTQARNDILNWRMQGAGNDPQTQLVDYNKRSLDELRTLNKTWENPQVISIK